MLSDKYTFIFNRGLFYLTGIILQVIILAIILVLYFLRIFSSILSTPVFFSCINAIFPSVLAVIGF
jgi:hypothetical protein